MDCSRRPCFFKVFLPELSSEYMTIPPAFSQHMETETETETETPGTIISLEGPSGKVWRVHLLKDSRGLCFYKGWKEFLADHSIVVGDLLLFRYDHSSHFTVSVFDYTACEKMSAFSATPQEQQDVRGTMPYHASIVPPNGTLEPDQRKTGVLVKMEKESDDDCFHIKRGRRLAASAIVESGLSFHASKSPKVGVALKTLSPSSSDRAVGGVRRGKGAKYIVQWKQKKKAHCIATSKTPLVKQVSKLDLHSLISLLRSTSKNPLKFNGTTSIKMKQLAAMVEEFRLYSLLSQGRPVTQQECSKALEMANSFKSKNPFVVKVMREANISKSFSLFFSRGFTAEYLSMDDENMTIWDPNGKPWVVKYSSYYKCGSFLGGWPEFCSAHNLQLHDVCVFELIQKNQMKVHIFSPGSGSAAMAQCEQRQE